jgi:uncharacterized membrane protein
MTRLKALAKYYPYIIIGGFATVLFLVNIRMNVFSYNNFDMGKFDLGNMTQMLWNTLHGRFMYLTDYFGTNLPRWSMSHVDPILLLFLPIFALYQHPLTLVFAQIIIVLASAFLVYGIGVLVIKSRFAATMVALAYLSYPAIGFLTSKTGFHGVTAAIPFFLLAFFCYEYMYQRDLVSKGWLVTFWVAILITISGKEQIALYTFLLGLYILLFRLPKNAGQVLKKHVVALCALSLVWFIGAFFVIIPAFAKQRVDGYQSFAQSLGIGNREVRNVALENYFLSRYDAFGDSYSDIIVGVLFNPSTAIKIIFGGDKLDNFKMTLAPVMYLPFAAPQISMMAVPDLLMNYLTSANGVGTSEISNHRISMIIPILFIAVIFALALINELLRKFRFKFTNWGYLSITLLSICLLSYNVYSSFALQNPVFMWLRDSIGKHLPQFIAYAKFDQEITARSDLKKGEVLKISALENKDRECAQKIVGQIPDDVSVSGPDYLGAHLSLRETYAIFPALYNQADYVIIDAFSKKIANILDLPPSLVNEVVNRVIKDPNYALQTSCGNLFVFKKIGPHNKSTLSPIQEYYSYPAKYDYTILNGLTVVDYQLPATLTRGVMANIRLAYLNKDKLDSNFIFMSFINSKTGLVYQSVNLPSFALIKTIDWKEDYYYVEDLELVLPNFVDPGDYRVFVGISNNIRTRSIYLGDVILQ